MKPYMTGLTDPYPKVELVEVMKVEFRRGLGTHDDPVRIVTRLLWPDSNGGLPIPFEEYDPVTRDFPVTA